MYEEKMCNVIFLVDGYWSMISTCGHLLQRELPVNGNPQKFRLNQNAIMIFLTSKYCFKASQKAIHKINSISINSFVYRKAL